MSLTAKLLISVGALFYILVIPLLEWNHSHVFNPQWPPHARFHEVWQLFTHITLGMIVLWLVWLRGQILLPALISCCVMSGVVFSHILSPFVGASVRSGNLTKHFLGFDLAVIVASLVVVMSLVSILFARKKGNLTL